MTHEEDLKQTQDVEEILVKELRKEMKKIVDAGAFAPGQTKTLLEAVDLMLSMKQYEGCCGGEMGMDEYSQKNYYGMNSYAQPRSTVTGRFTSRGMNPYAMRDHSYNDNAYGYGMPNSYEMNRSGHSTKDRMIARLEDMMGEAKNEYEAQMIRDTIANIQAGR